MPPDLAVLCHDAMEEQESVGALLAGAPESTWDLPTPAPGWTVRHQISHLAYFDGVASQAISDPEGFRVLRDGAMADIDGFVAQALDYGGDLDGAAFLERWGDKRRTLADAALAAPADVRIPWFGPDMGIASCITARIMETWAHGQDVADTLGVTRLPTPRLRHICDLGVRTRGFAFKVNGQPVPDAPVRVELDAPGGARWEWGPPDAAERVVGDACDFALLVTQRCHLDDTVLRVEGEGARRWMTIAQAFAGPPGGGRPQTRA